MFKSEHDHATVPGLVVLKLGGNGQFTRLGVGKGDAIACHGLECPPSDYSASTVHQAPEKMKCQQSPPFELLPHPPAIRTTQQQPMPQQLQKQVAACTTCNIRRDTVSLQRNNSLKINSSSDKFVSRIPAAPACICIGKQSQLLGQSLDSLAAVNSTPDPNTAAAIDTSNSILCIPKVPAIATAAHQEHHLLSSEVAASSPADIMLISTACSNSKSNSLVRANSPKLVGSTSPHAADKRNKANCSSTCRPGSPMKHWQIGSSTGSLINSNNSIGRYHDASNGGSNHSSKSSNGSRKDLSSPRQPMAVASSSSSAPSSPASPQMGLQEQQYCTAPAAAAAAMARGGLPVIAPGVLQQHKDRRRAELYALNAILTRSENMRVAAFLAQQQQQQQRAAGCASPAGEEVTNTVTAGSAASGLGPSYVDCMNHGV